MKRALFLALLIVPLLAVAQSRIYKGCSTYSSDILYTYDGKYLYCGNCTYGSDALYTFDGKHIYRGNSTYGSDALYTVSGRIPVAVIVALL